MKSKLENKNTSNQASLTIICFPFCGPGFVERQHKDFPEVAVFVALR